MGKVLYRWQTVPAVHSSWLAVYDLASCGRRSRGWPAFAGHDGGVGGVRQYFRPVISLYSFS
jgi:hypothetical protein